MSLNAQFRSKLTDFSEMAQTNANFNKELEKRDYEIT